MRIRHKDRRINGVLRNRKNKNSRFKIGGRFWGNDKNWKGNDMMRNWAAGLVLVMVLGAGCANQNAGKTNAGGSYEELLGVFKEFRELQKPVMVNGVPDYTAKAMTKQRRQLKELRKRLEAIDTKGWLITKQADFELVRAEFNGLEFNHSVLRPWARDPGFYSVFERFEQTQANAIKMPTMPIPKEQIEKFAEHIRAVPALLAQAKGNLKEACSDLAMIAERRKGREERMMQRLIDGLQKDHPELAGDAQKALLAIEDFRKWLGQNKRNMKAEAGIGVKNYNRLLKEVYLFPYTWQECMDIAEREYERCVADLKLEEHRNRNLAALEAATTAEEWTKRFIDSQQFLADFLRTNHIMSEPDYLQMRTYTLREPPKEKLDFFQNVQVRDPLPLMPHDFVGHSQDEARIKDNKNPIRKDYNLFHISGIRAEALATGSEEMLMHLGMLDERPRSRELVYMLRIFRAVRAMADLKMHNGELNFKEATEFCSRKVPYGWVVPDSNLIWEDLELYIRQPGYGMGYLVGAVDMEKLLAERAMQLGEDFTIQRFMGEFLSSGLAPLSLIRWEMTGNCEEIKKLRR